MKGKFIKKLMAYALTAAMVVSTPMTAFASEFADNFWVSDGDSTHDEAEHGPNPTGTGTVSSTDTDTTVLNNANITGIEIEVQDKGELETDSAFVIDLGVSKQRTLKAKVLYAEGTAPDETTQQMINEKISWRSSNLAIVRPAARKGNMSVCPVTGYKGGFANITAEIDVDGDKKADYMARVRVMVKKAPTAVYIKLPNEGTLYAGHTYDLNDYVSFNDDAFDEVVFNLELTDTDSKGKNKKLVTCTEDGFLKLDKKIKDNTLTGKLTATTKDGKVSSEPKDVIFSAGTPVTGLSFTSSSKDKINTSYDIKGDYDEDTATFKGKQKRTATVNIKTRDGKSTTDDITWTSSNSNIVRVFADDNEPFNEKTENLSVDQQGKMSRTVRFEGLNTGKATVIATATSGKSAKLNVTVTATLIKIVSAEVQGGQTYSGKATSLVIKRIPEQNQDKLKIVPVVKTNKLKGIKVKAAITPVLTPGADLSKVSIGAIKAENNVFTVVGDTLKVEQSKKNKGDTTAKSCNIKNEFKIYQSDVLVNTVMSAANGGTDMTPKKAQTVKVNPVRTLSYFAILDDAHKTPGQEAVSWESSKETVATIVGDGRIKVVGEGTAKITVSSTYEVKAGKYKTVKKAFTIKSTPKCEEIVLKSNLVTVKQGKAATINVKEQLPKKAADDITWYYYGADGKWIELTPSKTVTNKKCTLPANLTSSPGVITVVAVSGAVEAEAKIIVAPK